MYGRIKDFLVIDESDAEEEADQTVKSEPEVKEDEYDYDKHLFKERPLKKSKVTFEKEVKEVEVKYCDLCNKRVNNEREFNSHVNSKAHLKKLKESIRKDLSEYPNINSYLADKKIVSEERSCFNRVRRLLYVMSIKQMINS